MNEFVKNILKKIEENGFEAYIVGGYVRDSILNIETHDIDICTNALPKDIIQIFNLKSQSATYGSISLHEGKYKIDITTYRKDSNYFDRKPQTVEYTNNLHTDLERRDFTINSLCMNSSGNIIDLLNGKEDIEKRIIRVIGNTSAKLKEDPLRILRALKFSITLNFKLDEEILNFIKENKILIKTLSYYRIKEELERIMVSKNVVKGFDYLKELELLEVLELKYNQIKPVCDVLGIWAQIDYSHNYPFSKKSEKTINNIRSILKIGKIDNMVLYKYGLYISLVAGEILGYSKEEINLLYVKLPIKNYKELNITFNQISDIINSKDVLIIKNIYDNILNNVINEQLENDYEKIKNNILTR